MCRINSRRDVQEAFFFFFFTYVELPDSVLLSCISFVYTYIPWYSSAVLSSVVGKLVNIFLSANNRKTLDGWIVMALLGVACIFFFSLLSPQDCPEPLVLSFLACSSVVGRFFCRFL